MGPKAGFSFEPFRSVLAVTAAGYHDGQSVTVRLEHAADPVVLHHEGIHERIFAATPDGQVLSTLLQILRYSEETQAEVPASVGPLAQILIDGSRFAHEAAATYLAIKQFSPGAGDAVYARLPAQYRTYYHAVADVVDRAFKGSFLQYLLGVNVYAVAFTSPYLARLAKAGLASPPSPEQEELPDQRFRCVIEQFQSGDLADFRRQIDGAAAAVCRSEGGEPWDLESDEEWRQHWDISTRVEVAISDAARGWLRAKSRLPTLLEGKSHEEALRQFAAVVGPWVTLQVPSSDAPPPEDEAEFRHLTTEAYWQGDSTFQNANPKRVQRGDDRLLAVDDLFESLNAFQVLSAEPPHNLSEWYFAGWANADNEGRRLPDWLGGFSAEALKTWLARRRDRQRAGLSAPHPRSITVAVRDWKDLDAIHEDMLNRNSLVDEMGDVRGEGVAVLGWYWLGNWVKALEEWTEITPMESTKVYLTPNAKPTQAELASAPVLWVLKAPGVPGWVFRALSARANAWIFRVEKRLRRDGRLTDLEGDDRDVARYAITNAFELLRALWTRF
jgi:hypothetical protein